MPTIHPIKAVVKYSPPMIGIVYKRNPKEKKFKVYEIHIE
jgi:hypothetical protein